MLCVFLLSACNSKKNQIPTGSANLVSLSKTVVELPDELIRFTQSHNGYISALAQRFAVPSNALSTIEGRKGLKLTIDPKALEKEDGSAVDGKIMVSLVELTSSDELFKANAATVSDGKLIASGGSYFIEMECNGKKLRIKGKQSMKIELPVLQQSEMELFYGERDSLGDMNWKPANIPLQKQFLNQPLVESVGFRDDNIGDANDFPEFDRLYLEFNVYKSMNEIVYYYNRRMMLYQMVDTINKNGPRVYIDTLYNWPKDLPTDKWLDSNHLRQVYGPRITFRLKSIYALQKQKEAEEKRKAWQAKYIENWKPKTLAGQLQKYYAPTSIYKLGWINCDRYYRNGEPVEMDTDIPITMVNTRVDYFVIFRSLNGMIRDRFYFTGPQQMSLGKLPQGETATLVAFIRKDGVIYECRKDFKVERGGKLVLDFTVITKEKLASIFGNNVKA